MLCAQGQWTVLQGAEDTELLRKDAVHHLVKVGFCQYACAYIPAAQGRRAPPRQGAHLPTYSLARIGAY